MVPGLVLAFGAMAAHGQSPAPATAPTNPPVAPPSTPVELGLPPASAPQTIALDPALQPAAPPPPVRAVPGPAAPVTAPPPGSPDPLQAASEEVKRVARWVLDSGDNTRLPFLLIDKVNAKAYAFGPAGQLQDAAPVLLGMGKGDRLIAANDTRMGLIPPQDRITPAGRFVSRLAKDLHGKELLVLDYHASISLHPVVKGTPKERRAERLSSATPEDNRISYGCINVPVPFYQSVVSPAFTGTKGIVYVLPETSPAAVMFGFQPAGIAVAGSRPTTASLTLPAAQGAQLAPAAPAATGAPAVPAPDVR